MDPISLTGVGSSLLGGLFGGNSAKKAAKSQEQMAREQLKLQKQQYEQTRADMAPYKGAGDISQAAYLYELGLGPRPMIGAQPLSVETIGGQTTTRLMGNPNQAEGMTSIGNLLANRKTTTTPTQYRVGGRMFRTMDEANAFARDNGTPGQAYGGFQETPGYQFQLQQGLDDVQSSAAARGMLGSGATLNAINDYSQGLAKQEYGNYLNRLSGQASNGQNAAGMLGANNQNYANTGSNAYGSIGDARSAGYMGASNAFNGGIENALSAWKYGQNMKQPTS